MDPTTASQPVQLRNDAPEAAFGVIETVDPIVNGALQVLEQFIPAGALVTLPPSALVTEAFTGYAKLACTVLAVFAVIVQVLPLGASQPVQLTNVAPEAGVAVNTTGSL